MTVRTRLAPTPSGALHAGNAFSFLAAWLCARASDGTVVLRVEDVDSTRSRPEWIEALFRDLAWLGLDWDEGPSGPTDAQSAYRQSSSRRQARYRDVCEGWKAGGILYPCQCTRAQLRTDAPQVERIGQDLPPGVPYAGNCRARPTGEAGARDAWRLALPDSSSRVEDLWQGSRDLGSLELLGDPVLRRGDGVFAYHLAVCVDDADQGIDLVVRGRDLLPFGHLHAHLHGLLGHPVPRFAHHGLLGDAQGRRMAKRIGSGSLAALREAGRDPRELVGHLAPLLHPGRIPAGLRLSAPELVAYGMPAPPSQDLPCASLPGDDL
ncbi:MAG: tRNA glutamyl-Q(34) synthetase GluQRS [Fibrobacterota bacterium]|nr:tRNA glutamyl-Q(34) synthetase GluQRS [Fibrobacterota bacterium]QQS06472.1 MAG: tRNA glutamyl-Q(34) synthetase GluQRS [Fibrobacterota bacterium]